MYRMNFILTRKTRINNIIYLLLFIVLIFVWSRPTFLRSLYNGYFYLPSIQSDQSHLLEKTLSIELRNNEYRYSKKTVSQIPNVISTKLNYSEANFRLSSSPPILWLDMYGDPHWNEAAEREMYTYLLEKQTIDDSRSNDKIIDECLERPLFIINQQGWGFFSRVHRFLEQFGQTLYSPWMALLSNYRFSVSNAGRDDFLNEGIVRYFDPISTCSKFIRHSRLEPIRKRLRGANQNSMSVSKIDDLLYENQRKMNVKFRLLDKSTVWAFGYEHIPHRRALFDYNRGPLDYSYSFAYLINHTYEHMYHEPSLSSVYLNTWKSRNRPWGKSAINLPGKSYQVTWQDRLFSSFLYYMFARFFHQPAPRIRQLTHLLVDHWSTYLNDKNGQSLDALGGLFIRRGDKAREDSFWRKHKRWRNISMYVKGIVDEEQRRNQTFSSIFVMTDDVSVMKSLQDYANPRSKGIDEPYARQYLRGRQIMYNVFAPQACFDPFIRIGFEQFLVSLEFLVQYAKLIVGHSDSNVGRYLEELMYARHQLNVSVRTHSLVRDAPNSL
ncbi:unnamed protein product [Rotaria socialis]|uniref:Uncharacterized protein n=2 Tax=Rotaria socialis TaxID=392032 RepID=A0A821FKL1_9BILA|nr:unnamed protein product [Rotaria socialis]CAF3426296.1 unnamed protein product [Rotaria socialis]CAF4652063.1 unnamed protein product [Rotaria socialis]CAF4814183.1 unnamed protein product [Rotaria socialis]